MSTTSGEHTRHRSPAYPAFSLKVAVEKLALIYEAHRRAAIAPDTLKRTMGYELTTSHSMRAIAALIQFGLIEEDGGAERRLRVSELGLSIVLRKAMDSERVTHLRRAAMRPAIYRQMLDLWKDDLPPDEAISRFLLFDRNFNPAVVPAVIRDFRTTHQFARLSWVGAPGPVPSADEQTRGGAAERAGSDQCGVPPPGQDAGAPAAANVRRYQLPLPHGRIAVIEVPADAGEADMDFVVRYLLLMKEAM
ncbi:MAG TPA: hypothetical protein VKT77_19295 [Chthonomonadaceae bacterium]|nr:hypothetical protein [Chthonomonadaceae bacterium]